MLQTNKYLLIREWGCGFYADFLHVVQGLFLADSIGRVPLVHWGKESLYNNLNHEDVFSSFFDVGAIGLELDRTCLSGLSIYPAEYEEDPFSYFTSNKYEKDLELNLNYLRDLVNSDKDIVVYDRFMNLQNICKIVGVENLKSGYKSLVNQYHKPSAEVLQLLTSRLLKINYSLDRKFNAIQLRLSEKVRTEEAQRIALDNYYNYFMNNISDASADLFVCSESQLAIDYFKETYPGRVIVTPANRKVHKFSADSQRLGIKDNQFVPEFLLKTPGLDKKYMGFEVMLDVLIASNAEKFFGSYSNVAKIIAYLQQDNAESVLLPTEGVISADEMKVKI